MTLLVDYRVPARSWHAIGQDAWAWRGSLGFQEKPLLPIDRILEMLGYTPGFFELHIADRTLMGDAEGQTCPLGTFIRIRQDVYENACRGDGRARFTLAHEFGHWVLHSTLPLQRVSDRKQVKAYCLAEPQANAFAARFLMPAQMLQAGDEVEHVMQRFQVTRSAAAARLADFDKKGC